MALTFVRKTRQIRLASGPVATIAPLVGKHQSILTDQKSNWNAKINNILADVLVGVEGVDLESMSPNAKLQFVKRMLSADRTIVLVQARQLSMGNKPSIVYTHEWKEGSVKKTQSYQIELITEDEYDANFKQVKELRPQADEALLAELNAVGCFPTLPYAKSYKSYEDVLNNKDVEFKGVPNFEDVTFIFRMLDGEAEAKVNSNVNSHDAYLLRRLRYKEEGNDLTHKVTKEDLDQMPLDSLAYIQAQIESAEGEVDTKEQIENPNRNEGGLIDIDLVFQAGFFFPKSSKA